MILNQLTELAEDLDAEFRHEEKKFRVISEVLFRFQFID